MPDAHLLLVDDDPAILRALERTLKNEGYQLFFASSAEEAHDVIREHAIHVIVSDNNMGAISGLDLLETLRAEHPYITRILMTAHADPDTRRRADAIGVHGFIEKPWQVEALKGLLREAVGLALEQTDRMASPGTGASP
jgi:DNA-binding NtrC family response regulator